MLAALSVLVLLADRFDFVRPAPAATADVPAAAQGAPWPAPGPIIRSAELWFATAPAAGVWAECKVVLDNPLPKGASKTVLLVSGTVMQDFRVRSTEPKLLTPPRRRPDGRYAFVFPAPLPESLNWYRLHLEARGASPRPLQIGFTLDRVPAAQAAQADQERQPVPVQVFYSDRQNDPFMVVPEALVSWMPSHTRSAFPLLLLYAVAVGGVAAAGCIAAFWVVRR